MQILKSPEDAKQWRLNNPRAAAFIPTMGALHKGHTSLIEEAKKQQSQVIVSIFVNPTQFGPNEDLEQYPRTLETDLDILRELEVEAVFLPTKKAMYSDSFDTYVKAGALGKSLCGISRPTHFDGVLTIVTKLFNILQPTSAYFGKKDYQQFRLIEQAVEDLSIDVEVVGCDTLRETSGLAMSSRNMRLTDRERSSASVIYKLLKESKALVDKGSKLTNESLGKIKTELQSHGFEPDYVELCDRQKLQPITESVHGKSILLIAAKIGHVRLIDNIEL